MAARSEHPISVVAGQCDKAIALPADVTDPLVMEQVFKIFVARAERLDV
ncbi:hypothetical protein [Pseudopelagicola sp. nBUS_19]